MDMRVYKKTRYQNIYKHIKNGNFVISLSKPVKTSISRIEEKKIFSIEEAIKIRDKYINHSIKSNLSEFVDDLDTLWDKYMFDCKYVKKLAYNSILRKEKAYNKYLKGKITKKVSKTNKIFWIKYIDELKTTDKQKNEVIRQLKCLFNWAVENDILVINPIDKVKKYKVINKEMEIWTEEDFLMFIKTINEDIISEDKFIKKVAYIIKIIAYAGFCYGLRIGETRALIYSTLKIEEATLKINRSINYDSDSSSFLVPTKTDKSTRELIVSRQFIDLVYEYKKFLEVEFEIEVKQQDIIIFNYNNNTPYNDSTLRKHFNNYIKKSGVKKIRMYDLRHSYATNMLLHDVSIKYVSEDMGHSSIKITGDVYSHIIDKKRKEIAKITDNLFI